jgi:hypothetical protein
MQSAQILLSRLQIQEVTVTRASQHLDETRSKLAQVEVVTGAKRPKLNISGTNSLKPQRAGQVEEVRKRWGKSDLEVSTDLKEQRQAAEIEPNSNCDCAGQSRQSRSSIGRTGPRHGEAERAVQSRPEFSGMKYKFVMATLAG